MLHCKFMQINDFYPDLEIEKREPVKLIEKTTPTNKKRNGIWVSFWYWKMFGCWETRGKKTSIIIFTKAVQTTNIELPQIAFSHGKLLKDMKDSASIIILWDFINEVKILLDYVQF